MSTFKDWEEFCNYITFKNRYILDEKNQKILNEIISLAKEREINIAKDTLFYRARTSQGLKIHEDGEIYSPSYSEDDLLAPPPEKASNGRANPQGIPYLYLAEDAQTAIAEIKPDIGDNITIASFCLAKDIKVVDITAGVPSLIEAIYSKDKQSFDHLWFGIKMSFQVPVKAGHPLGYLPTQYITELFKTEGYDGIKFNSVQNQEKFNLTLFDKANVNFIDVNTNYIAAIEYIDLVTYYKRKNQNT